MDRRSLCLAAAAALLSACAPPVATTGPGGIPVYRITRREAERIPGRVLEELNALRLAQGLAPVRLDPALTAAAAAHAGDMARQNRPWWVGSDASNPLVRAARAGYPGQVLGEMVSETFETEMQTLDAWAADPVTRPILLDPRATDAGFAWVQEQGGKLWWTLNLGQGGAGPAERAPLAGGPIAAVF